MATVAIVLLGAVVNALAFTGGNYLFSIFDTDGSKAESRAHSKASIEMNIANQQRQKRLDYLQEVFNKEQSAEGEFQNVDLAFEEYSKLKEPLKLSEFYKPSETQIKYEYYFILIVFGIAFSFIYHYTK